MELKQASKGEEQGEEEKEFFILFVYLWSEQVG